MKKKFLLAISFFILTINFSSAEIINLENPTFDKDIFIPKNKTIEKIINEKVNDWYGVYISNKKVGWYNGSFNKFNDDLYKIEEKLYLLMDMPGLEEGSKITSESKITYSMFYESTFPYRMVKYDELTTDNEGNESIEAVTVNVTNVDETPALETISAPNPDPLEDTAEPDPESAIMSETESEPFSLIWTKLLGSSADDISWGINTGNDGSI